MIASLEMIENNCEIYLLNMYKKKCAALLSRVWYASVCSAIANVDNVASIAPPSVESINRVLGDAVQHLQTAGTRQ